LSVKVASHRRADREEGGSPAYLGRFTLEERLMEKRMGGEGTPQGGCGNRAKPCFFHLDPISRGRGKKIFTDLLGGAEGRRACVVISKPGREIFCHVALGEDSTEKRGGGRKLCIIARKRGKKLLVKRRPYLLLPF